MFTLISKDQKKNINCTMVDVRGDVLRPPHGTTPAAVKANKIQKCVPLRAMFTQKFIKIFHSVQETGPFSLFPNLALGKASTDNKCHLQVLGLDLFNIKLSAKFYQNIPNSLRVNFHFFQNLNLGKTSWATSCQYTNVYAKFHHNIPLSSRDRAIFTFSEFGARQNLHRWKMTFHNLLG